MRVFRIGITAQQNAKRSVKRERMYLLSFCHPIASLPRFFCCCHAKGMKGCCVLVQTEKRDKQKKTLTSPLQVHPFFFAIPLLVLFSVTLPFPLAPFFVFYYNGLIVQQNNLFHCRDSWTTLSVTAIEVVLNLFFFFSSSTIVKKKTRKRRKKDWWMDRSRRIFSFSFPPSFPYFPSFAVAFLLCFPDPVQQGLSIDTLFLPLTH